MSVHYLTNFFFLKWLYVPTNLFFISSITTIYYYPGIYTLRRCFRLQREKKITFIRYRSSSMSGFSWTAALTTTMLCLDVDLGAFFTDRWDSTCIDRPRLMMLGFFGESRNGFKCCTSNKYRVYYGQLFAPPIGRLTVYDM